MLKLEVITPARWLLSGAASPHSLVPAARPVPCAGGSTQIQRRNWRLTPS